MIRESDMPAANGAGSVLPSEAWDRLERVLDRFENAWRRGDRPDLADYVAAAEAERRALLIELAQEDLEYRLRAGEPARAEDYLECYPELRGDPTVLRDLIAVEYANRGEHERGQLLEEVRRRFPQDHDYVSLPLPAQADGAARRRPARFSVTPSVAPAPGEEAAADLPQVPGYEVLGLLGRGGMGVVYKARHLALGRLVALKMIGTGAHAGPEERARFRTEAEAVARLQHPQIVQVYEVGECAGRPYLALEYVAGDSLAQTLAGTPQPPREAAALAETLARAVHAAHAHGVIHRDLKPANILLLFSREPRASADGYHQDTSALARGSWLNEAIPKITDFGLAKRLDEDAAQTRSGTPLGTPSYMAPEQAAGASRLIGPATDVYALGAILYEMLTGRPPFRGASVLETLDQVRQQEPVTPRQLQPRLPRDLETVCVKCLQKEPGKRYASALELADDLRRFLDGQPVRARPVGALERSVKWAKRRPLAAALAAVCLAAVLGLVAATVLIEEARRQADREAAAAQLQEQQARANYERAEHSYRLARQAMDSCLAEIRKDPRFKEGPLEDVRKNLLRGELKFYEEFAAQRGDEPAFKAERGEAYLRLGKILRELEGEAKSLPSFREALALFAALAHDDPEVPVYRAQLAETHLLIGAVYSNTARPQEAEEAFEEALALDKALVREHPAEGRYQRHLATTLTNLGLVYDNTNRPRQAEQAWRDALAVLKPLAERDPADPDDPYALAECQNNLGSCLAKSGRRAEATQAREEALRTIKALAERYPDNPQYQFYRAMMSMNLALQYHTVGRSSEAEPAWGEALATQRALADRHPLVGKYAHGLALLLSYRGHTLRDLGRPAEALPCYAEAAASLEARLVKSPNDSSILSLLYDIYQGRGKTLNRMGRPAEALPDFDRAVALATTADMRSVRLHRAAALALLGDHACATAEADAVAAGTLVTVATLYNLGVVYSLSAAAVRNDPSLTERYAARAVSFLRQAVEKGFANQQLLEHDPNWEAVRGREDFRQLAAALAEGKR